MFTSVGTHNALGLQSPDIFHEGDMAREVSRIHPHNATLQQPLHQANLALCLCARLIVVHASSRLCVAAGASAGCEARMPAAGWR